mmetsp:Transcript_103550/g.259632  ORF Transcript_103550/g.259632 Transcript_103550/m.259632 type:complete len:279 (-) Transcript_103550:161-997(-)
MRSSMALASMFLALQPTASKVLIVGDSNAEYSGTSLASFCKGAVVKNAGVGGTTAVQWTSTEGHLDKIGSSACGGTPDYIWLSVGGNDNFETQCSSSVADLAAKITASINAVKQKAPSAKILMTGYCMPMSPESEDAACNSPGKFNALMDAVKQAADGDSAVTLVDSTQACGGSASTWSDSKYFMDAIHLNNKGYCKLFTQAGVQTFLGCEAASYDCETVNCMTPGFDQHCGDPTLESCETCCSPASGVADSDKTERVSSMLPPLLLPSLLVPALIAF